MAYTSRYCINSISEHIKNYHTGYDFFQAVECIELLSPSRVPVGFDGPPKEEVIHFSPTANFTFSASEIANISEISNESPIDFSTTFLSLYGRDGVLPWHYTTQLRDEAKNYKKESMKEFLDIFNHRFISYFYRASRKYSIPKGYNQKDISSVENKMLSLGGLGTRYLGDKTPLGTRTAQFVNLLQLPKSAESLLLILKSMFSINVQVKQFMGEWVDIDDALLTRIGTLGNNNCLGHDICLGRRIWSSQHKFQLTLGPLTFCEYLEYNPGTEKCDNLIDVVTFFCGPTLIFDLHYEIKRETVYPFTLGGKQLQLGKDLWLTSNRTDSDPIPLERLYKPDSSWLL